MPGTIPNPVWIFRMVHISNLEYVLTHGIHTRNHPNADPNYINIGDTELISKRSTWPVKIDPPGGMLGDYVPFYFGGHSPMLLKIKTGHGGVKMRSQSEIVFLCCKLDVTTTECAEWCFTDGHAITKITNYYTDLNDLSNVHWDCVKLRYWNPIDNNLDRERRKQAEFLVKHEVPPKCIGGIIVFDQPACNTVDFLLKKHNIQIRIKVDQQRNYYY